MPKIWKYGTLENYLAWKHLREELRWPVAKIAYELDVNEQRLIDWINLSANEMQRLADKQPGKVKEIREALQEKHPISEPEKRELPNIDIKKAAKFCNEGLTLPEISAKFKVAHSDFIFWWNQNLKLINTEVRRLNNVITENF